MFRKFVLASAALATLGVASLASVAPASAGWHGHHHHHHFGPRFIARPVIIAGDYGCWRKRFIETPYGVIVKQRQRLLLKLSSMMFSENRFTLFGIML